MRQPCSETGWWNSTNPIGFVRASTQTIIGRVASDFVGAIDEVRVYNRALTAVEVAGLP